MQYIESCDVCVPVAVRVGALEGIDGRRRRDALQPNIDRPFVQSAKLHGGAFPDLYVAVELFYDRLRRVRPPATAQQHPPLRTAYRAFATQCRWDETVVLPQRFCDLPQDACLVFTACDVHAPRSALPLAWAQLPLFNHRRVLRKGRQKLLLVETPQQQQAAAATTAKAAPTSLEVERLERLVKRHARAELEHVEWLDAFTFTQIERVKRDCEREADDAMFLFVDLPIFPHPVVFAPMRCPFDQQQQQPQQKTEHSLIVLAPDPELGMLDNPVEAKHLKLARSAHEAAALAVGTAAELKPNSLETKRLVAIMRYPPLKELTYEDKDLLWRFAAHLSRQKKALSKFLRSVDWSDAEEVKTAMLLVKRWEPVDPEDALLLLANRFPSEHVRRYAVGRLRAAADDQFLRDYLIELVQAMRYEVRSTDRCLSKFLIERASKNAVLGSLFFWYLTVEAEDSSFFEDMRSEFMQARPAVAAEASQRQVYMVDKIAELQNALRGSGLPRPKQIEKMRLMLSPHGEYEQLFSFLPLPLCVDPAFVVTGVVPEESYVYKSALMPVGVTFKTQGSGGVEGRYRVIFKSGNDLRQDQLIIQMIALMDTLLKKENLDLKLTPYRVLATSSTEGFVQCVNAQSIDHVIRNYDGDIQRYLRLHHPDPHGPYGIESGVLDTFVKSCAGNSVITHILGVGDRHLDNLMLTPDGALFHIDFGFVLGNENKPFPPPMKLCKEMVNGMGGPGSPHYNLFKQYCCETYTILRKSADLIVGLFLLMVDAKIPDLAREPEKALLKLQEKFRLDLTAEEATQALLILINESVGALFPVFVDSIHRFMQYWRS